MAVNPKYTHLFFDLDNTLWDFDRNARLAMQATVCDLKLDRQIQDFDRFYDFYETVNTRLWEAYRKQEIRKNELITKRFSDTLQEFGILQNPEAMNEKYLQLMVEQDCLIEGAYELLTELNKRKFHLQIITNGFAEVQRNKLSKCSINHYFEHVFTSEEVGYPKPDIRIFKHAIRSSNAKKGKSIMIGDNWDTDILGARNYGIDQIFFSKNTEKRDIPKQNTPLNTKTTIFPDNNLPVKTYCIEKLTNILLFI